MFQCVTIPSQRLSVASLFVPAFVASVYGLLKPGRPSSGAREGSEGASAYGTGEGGVSEYDPSESRGRNNYSEGEYSPGEDEYTQETAKESFAGGDSSRLPPDSEEVSRDERASGSALDDASSQKRLRAFICLAIFVAMFFLFLVFLIDVIGVPVTRTKIHNASKGTVNSQIGGAVSFILPKILQRN